MKVFGEKISVFAQRREWAPDVDLLIAKELTHREGELETRQIGEIVWQP